MLYSEHAQSCVVPEQLPTAQAEPVEFLGSWLQVSLAQMLGPGHLAGCAPQSRKAGLSRPGQDQRQRPDLQS